MRTHRMSCYRFLGVSIAFIVASSDLHAALVIENLNVNVRDDSEIADSTVTAQPAYWAAQAFTTDNQAYKLDSIQARVGNVSGTPNVVAQLYSNSGTDEIDSLLTSLSAPTIDAAFDAKTFTANGMVTLAPNTSYWFVLGVTGLGGFEWSYADTADALVFNGPGSVPTPNSFADSDNSGGTWSYRELGVFAGSGAYLFRVDGTVVPEPASTAGLLLIGCWTFGQFRNRSRGLRERRSCGHTS